MKSKLYLYFFVSLLVLVFGLLYFQMLYSNRIVVQKAVSAVPEESIRKEGKNQADEQGDNYGKTEEKKVSDSIDSKADKQHKKSQKSKEKKTEIESEMEQAGKSKESSDEKIVNTKQEQENQTKKSKLEKSGKINLNTASKAELMQLKGIGEKKADLIIRFRTEKGSFKKIEDIMKIKGIKRKGFDKIKDYIEVGDEGKE